MLSLTDRARVQIAQAYAEGDLEALRGLALAAVKDYETARDAYDAHLREHYTGAAS